ncbi:MAG: hypothetical protein ACOXZK_02540 [Bacteroidales bacterium]|jgi:hypothetical protein|nr:hypothetical protein [Bacteroidales bacterium]
MATNYGQVRPLTTEEKKEFAPIISDFETATGARLTQENVATMSDGETGKIIGYHLLNKNADSSKPDNLVSALLIVDKSEDRPRATILGTHISTRENSIDSISLRTKNLDVISDSNEIHPIKYPTEPPTQNEEPEYQTMMISSPSISNLSYKDGHITGTIDVSVLGIFSWDVIGFDIDVKNRTLDWWWID